MKSDFETLQNDLSFLSSLVVCVPSFFFQFFSQLIFSHNKLQSQGDGKGDNEGALLELRKLDKKILELGQSLELMNADGTGYADWALRSAGSTVWKASPSYLSGVLDSSVDHLITVFSLSFSFLFLPFFFADEAVKIGRNKYWGMLAHERNQRKCNYQIRTSHSPDSLFNRSHPNGAKRSFVQCPKGSDRFGKFFFCEKKKKNQSIILLKKM